MKNLAFFLGGFVFVIAFALLPEITFAAEYTAEVSENQSLESNSIITTTAICLMLALGWVAGSFR